MIAAPALAREAFFSADFPEEELRGYWKVMQDESYMAFLEMVALDLPQPAKGPLVQESFLRPRQLLALSWIAREG